MGNVTSVDTDVQGKVACLTSGNEDWDTMVGCREEELVMADP